MVLLAHRLVLLVIVAGEVTYVLQLASSCRPLLLTPSCQFDAMSHANLNILRRGAVWLGAIPDRVIHSGTTEIGTAYIASVGREGSVYSWDAPGLCWDLVSGAGYLVCAMTCFWCLLWQVFPDLRCSAFERASLRQIGDRGEHHSGRERALGAARRGRQL